MKHSRRMKMVSLTITIRNPNKSKMTMEHWLRRGTRDQHKEVSRIKIGITIITAGMMKKREKQELLIREKGRQQALHSLAPYAIRRDT
jgi:hypothetical protein